MNRTPHYQTASPAAAPRGFRNLYAVEPDTQTLTEKIDALRWFADEIIAKV